MLNASEWDIMANMWPREPYLAKEFETRSLHLNQRNKSLPLVSIWYFVAHPSVAMATTDIKNANQRQSITSRRGSLPLQLHANSLQRQSQFAPLATANLCHACLVSMLASLACTTAARVCSNKSLGSEDRCPLCARRGRDFLVSWSRG